MSHLPGPVPTEAATVPIDNGGRFHDPERRLPSGPQLRQTNPKSSIDRLQFGPRILTLQHDDLMPKRQDLQLIVGLRAEVCAEGQNERNQHVKHGAEAYAGTCRSSTISTATGFLGITT